MNISNYAGADACAKSYSEQPASAVESQFAMLAEEQERTRYMVQQLRSKIESITAPAPPTNSAAKDGGIRAAQPTQLLRTLEDSVTRHRDINAELGFLIDSIVL